ncbi:hypothetical protein G7Y89_g5169 [Cudoniella acicularis]|uniref:Uncharacterized protein n=1 Tax=Cudoniella acicularis TaxID=354080 RepID=A0A8H4RMZ8_9HELO|nr:hypothetical protein G7Y89_g5169 [Cudoniella acicularis]
MRTAYHAAGKIDRVPAAQNRLEPESKGMADLTVQRQLGFTACSNLHCGTLRKVDIDMDNIGSLVYMSGSFGISPDCLAGFSSRNLESEQFYLGKAGSQRGTNGRNAASEDEAPFHLIEPQKANGENAPKQQATSNRIFLVRQKAIATAHCASTALGLVQTYILPPRYVVLGTGAHLKTQTDILSETSSRSSARRGLKSTPSKPNLVEVTQPEVEGQEQRLYVSIYKAKGDWEFISQFPLSTFKSCEIKPVQHRKQGNSVLTLTLEFKADSVSDKQRKRRSSRTALTSKDPWANVLLFRTVPDERYNIADWLNALKPRLTPDTPEDSPLSPASPSFHTFTNPFAPRDTKSSAGSTGRDIQRGSNQTVGPYLHGSRDRPSQLISPSPSLRSRRSDLSSQASSLHPPMGFTSSHPQNYTTTLPSDLPSPALTSGYDAQFIEGWTSAQGRSSALSSHTRGSNSIASAISPMFASTPPGPRETILDRAFQMRCIPGSERVPEKDEEKVSSIARFEALMREVDERKKQKGIVSQENTRKKQEWDLDEEREDSDVVESDDDGLDMSDHDVGMPTPAQRALDYISGRRPPVPQSLRPLSPTPRSPPIPFLNQQAMSAFHGGPSSSGGLRPRAGTTSSRNRTSRPSSMALPSRSMSSAAIPTLKEMKEGIRENSNSGNGNLKANNDDKRQEKRRSSTSVKRLSFQEFAKRLSSTSSLLLVQTNASSSSGRDGSRRTSSEYEFGSEEQSIRSPAIGNSIRDSRDKRCGWRGSVGVFGGEGGFL